MLEDDDEDQREKEIRPEQKDGAHLPDYGDDYDDYVQRRRRRLFSVVTDQSDGNRSVTLNISQPQPESQRPVEPEESAIPPTPKHLLHLQQNRSVRAQKAEGQVQRTGPRKPKRRSGQAKKAKVRAAEAAGQEKPVTAAGNRQRPAREAGEQPGPKKLHVQGAQNMMEARQKLKHRKSETEGEEEHVAASERGHPGERVSQRDTDASNRLREKEIEMNMPLQQETMNAKERNENTWSEPKDEEVPSWAAEEDHREVNLRGNGKRGRESVWGPGDGAEEEEPTPPPVFDTDVNWSQTFQVNHLDLQAFRSDWIDLRCNISGNLLLEATDAMPVVKAFMEKLNEKHHW